MATETLDELQVTKRLYAGVEEWTQWNWRSAGDIMLNGAYFVPSGAGAADNYVLASSLGAKPAILVETITGEAGVLQGRTESNRNDNTHMSVSAASISIFSTSHSHPIIHIFICAACLALMDVLR